MILNKLEQIFEREFDNLYPYQQEMFEYEFKQRIYSRRWCARNGIDYKHPNVLLAKVFTYDEIFKEDLK